MRLYNSRVPAMVKEIVQGLIAQELIEVAASNLSEVELDVESVFKEYLRTERQLTEEAKDLSHKRGLDYSAHQKIKRQLANRRKFGLYDDSVPYICNQLIETLLHTRNVEEIYADDRDLRAAIGPLLKKHMSSGDQLDVEVRRRIKNLEEGTLDWEIQYQQTLARLKDAHGISDS